MHNVTVRACERNVSGE